MSVTMQLSEAEERWARAFLDAMNMDSSEFAPTPPPSPRLDRAPPTKTSLLSGMKSRLPGKRSSPVLPSEETALEDARLLTTGSFAKLGGGGESVGRMVEKSVPTAANEKIMERKKVLDEFVGTKGYKKRVVDPVKTVLDNAETLAKQGTLGSELAKLKVSLRKERDGYQKRLGGEKDVDKRDQRERKVKAIEARLLALDEIQWSLIENDGVSHEQRVSRLQTMAPEKQIGILDNNKPLRLALLDQAEKERPTAQNFGVILSSLRMSDRGKDLINETCVKVASDNADDETFMQELCESVCSTEAGPRATVGTLFRGNSVFSKLTRDYVMTAPSCQDLLKRDLPRRREALVTGSFDGYAEAERQRAADEKDNKVVKTQKELLLEYVAEQETEIEEWIDGLIDSCLSEDVTLPDAILRICALYGQSLETVCRRENVQDSEDKIAVALGGFLFLRLVNPALISKDVQPGGKTIPLDAAEGYLMGQITGVVQSIMNQTPSKTLLKDYVTQKTPVVKQQLLKLYERATADS